MKAHQYVKLFNLANSTEMWNYQKDNKIKGTAHLDHKDCRVNGTRNHTKNAEKFIELLTIDFYTNLNKYGKYPSNRHIEICKKHIKDKFIGISNKSFGTLKESLLEDFYRSLDLSC